MFALTGWKTAEINGLEFELNSIFVEKWEGKTYRLVIQRQKRIEGDLDIWEGKYTYRCILTNDYKSSARDIVEFYNLLAYDSSHQKLLQSYYAEIENHEFGLRATCGIKTFVVFKFITIPTKWVKTSRRHVLNIYTDNYAYVNLFQTDFGKKHAFLVKPAYYLKLLYGVKGFCVCEVSVVQEICTIK